MTQKIALIGAGAMGGAIGTRLADTGNILTVFDLDAQRVQALVARGARPAGSAAEAASVSDYVVSSLNSAKVVDAAVFGQDGVAAGAKLGTLIIDMSSIDPLATKALAARAADIDLRWVDSPLSGGPQKALTGELTLMAGGDAADVEEAHKVLKHVSSNYTHMGPSGAGQTTKRINQVLCGLGFMAIAEATQLAVDTGIDVAKIPKALKGGRADSVLLQEYMPRFFLQGLPSHRAHRQHGKGPRRSTGSRTDDKYRNAAHCCVCRDSQDACRGRAGRRGSGHADGVLQGARQGAVSIIERIAPLARESRWHVKSGRLWGRTSHGVRFASMLRPHRV